MKRFWFEDEGAVAVIVALSIFVLVAFTAVAVDVGYMYSEKRQLQTAADAAALAGCRVLADGGANGAIDAEARAYAAVNSVAPGDDLYVEDVEIGADYVQVTVGKDSPLFFAAVFGTDSSLIRANARANVAYLTGARGVVPWGVPIVKTPTRVTVTVGAGTEISLDNKGGGVWEKTFSGPGVRSSTGYPMNVTVYNSQTAKPNGSSNGCPNGVPEVLSGGGRVFVPPTDCPITGVSLSKYVVDVDEAGSNVQLRVYSPGAKSVNATFNKKNVSLSLVNASTGLWQADLTVPYTEDRISTYPVNVQSDKYKASSVATLVVRRQSYPVLDVQPLGGDYVVGPGGSVTVRVNINDFVYGELYTLRVDAHGNETGDFCCLCLADTQAFGTTGPIYPGMSKGANGYREYLGNGFPEAIHIGDVVYTEPGNMSGPNKQAMDTRFAGDNRTWNQWVAAGKPATRRIVFLPLIEKMETGNKPPLRVVAFGAFYVEPSSSSGNGSTGSLIVGRFIEYVMPSDVISEGPTDSIYLKTVHLVAPE